MPEKLSYLSHPHRIMKFLAKVKSEGVVTYAHVKFMKPVGVDYNRLKDRAEEVVPYTDAEFDLQKVKDIFTEREYMTPAEFDNAKSLLETRSLIASDKFDATPAAVQLHRDMEVEEKTRRDAEIQDKRDKGIFKL